MIKLHAPCDFADIGLTTWDFEDRGESSVCTKCIWSKGDGRKQPWLCNEKNSSIVPSCPRNKVEWEGQAPWKLIKIRVIDRQAPFSDLYCFLWLTSQLYSNSVLRTCRKKTKAIGFRLNTPSSSPHKARSDTRWPSLATAGHMRHISREWQGTGLCFPASAWEERDRAPHFDIYFYPFELFMWLQVAMKSRRPVGSPAGASSWDAEKSGWLVVGGQSGRKPQACPWQGSAGLTSLSGCLRYNDMAGPWRWCFDAG